MKLTEYDWDKQANVQVEYSDGPIAQFVDRFRQTKAWETDLERIRRWVLALNKALATEREERRLALAATAVAMSDPAPAPKPRTKGGPRAADTEGV